MTDDDAELLRKAMRGVTPMRPAKPLPKPVVKLPPKPVVAAPAPVLSEIDVLRARLAAAEVRAVAAESHVAVPLRELLAARGLAGAQEMQAAVRALAAEETLLDRLVVSDVSFVTRFLAERIFLGSPLDDVPAGALLVRVPAERSEGDWSPAAREAMSKFSTACLVRGWRRITFVSAPERWHRILGSGLDRRLTVGFQTPEDPLHGDVSVAVGVEVAGAVSAPASNLAAMLIAAVEGIGRR